MLVSSVMATSTSDNGFEDWLCKKLTSLEIDNEVYGSYISGILQDSEESERKDALQEILESLIVSTIDKSEMLAKVETIGLGYYAGL